MRGIEKGGPAMISDELLNKFDSIEDLPVSEEMLGAYMEGNLSDTEISEILPTISQSTIISNLITSVEENELNENNLENFIDDEIDFPDEDFFTSVNETEETEFMIGKSYNIYGEAGENIKDPVYIQQPDDHSCALRSQQIVLRDFGIDIPFDKLEQLALSNGVYSDQGTYTYDIGKVLQIAGVDMHQVQGSTLMDLTNELAQGHRVIVSVDANELWYTDPASKLKNWFDDAIGKQGGNHALIVAGVEVNPENPNDVKVVLTDPGAGHLRVEYPLDQFMDAWKDSKCFMAATDYPAPYQYDPETGMEVPSNFMVQQFVNDFIASNGYQLSPDLINMPSDYQPAFTGHLDMVGEVDYASFEKDYLDYKDSQFPSNLSVAEQIEEVAKRSINTTGNIHGNDSHIHDEEIAAVNASSSINQYGSSVAVSEVLYGHSSSTDNDDDFNDEDDEHSDSISGEIHTDGHEEAEEDDNDDNDDLYDEQ